MPSLKRPAGGDRMGLCTIHHDSLDFHGSKNDFHGLDMQKEELVYILRR
jgi:hypothetical protein